MTHAGGEKERGNRTAEDDEEFIFSVPDAR